MSSKQVPATIGRGVRLSNGGIVAHRRPTLRIPRDFVPHARRVTRSRLMAHPMSRAEWVVALNRANDYAGWTQYLREGDRRGR